MVRSTQFLVWGPAPRKGVHQTELGQSCSSPRLRQSRGPYPKLQSTRNGVPAKCRGILFPSRQLRDIRLIDPMAQSMQRRAERYYWYFELKDGIRLSSSPTPTMLEQMAHASCRCQAAPPLAIYRPGVRNLRRVVVNRYQLLQQEKRRRVLSEFSVNRPFCGHCANGGRRRVMDPGKQNFLFFLRPSRNPVLERTIEQHMFWELAGQARVTQPVSLRS